MILDEIVEDKKKRLTCHKKNVSETVKRSFRNPTSFDKPEQKSPKP